jgi:integrase
VVLRSRLLLRFLSFLGMTTTCASFSSWPSRGGLQQSARGKTNKRIRPATVNRELACLKALFNYAMKGETVLRNPVSAVKFLPEQNQQERVLTYKEQRLYLAEATPILRNVAGLILETGMRPEEVYTLQRPNIELARGFIKVTQGKTSTARRRVELTNRGGPAHPPRAAEEFQGAPTFSHVRLTRTVLSQRSTMPTTAPCETARLPLPPLRSPAHLGYTGSRGRH